MFCQYQYYRDTKQLQTAVDHSDDKYQCKEMSNCPYTGTTVINNIPWEDWPAGVDDGETEEDRENEESADPKEESTTGRKPGLMNKLKRLFRK